MKVLSLTGSIIFTVLILIVSFQNIGAICTMVTVFFAPVNMSPTFIFFGMALLGIFAGGFYFAFISSLMKSDDEEEM